MQTPDDNDLRSIEQHVTRYSRRPRPPRQIGDVISNLLARSGYAEVQSNAALQQAWAEAVGESWARYSRPARLRRGVLQIVVQNSIALQELAFQKSQLLRRMKEAFKDEKIRDLRFQVGPLDE